MTLMQQFYHTVYTVWLDNLDTQWYSVDLYKHANIKNLSVVKGCARPDSLLTIKSETQLMDM